MSNSMKAETLEEAKDRLLAVSAAEREGMEASTEGQLVADRGTPAAENSVEALALQRHQEARLAPPTSDAKDDGQNTVSEQDVGLGAAEEAPAQEARTTRRSRASSASDE